jgi:predicted MPP superfamily phosphohydrolase
MYGNKNSMYYKTPGIIVLFILVLSSCSLIDDVLNVKPPGGEVTGSGPDKLKFVAIGDTGKGNAGQFEVAQAIKTKCEKDGCDFILMLGDNIYDSGVNSINDDQFQTKFEVPYKELTIPFYMVLGNHDYGGNGAGYDVEKSVHQIRYTEISSKWRMPRHFYRLQVENTTFFALDTNAQMFNLAKDQEKDVSRWIAEANTTWKIAFGHHPYISNGRHGNAGKYEGVPDVPIISGDDVKKFAESVWCGKVDLYISAHDHNRQWLGSDCEGTQLAISGAGSSTTKLQGSNPSLFETDTLGILYVSIDGNILTAEFVGVDGNTEFTHTMEKK